MPLAGGYLLDTNILVAMVRGNDLEKYLDSVYGLWTPITPLMISAVTVGELLALSRKLAWGAKRIAVMHTVLARFYAKEIKDPQIFEAYAQIDAAADAAGRPMGKNDVWIAATARATNTTILTTDKDFDHFHGIWFDREWVDPTSKLTP